MIRNRYPTSDEKFQICSKLIQKTKVAFVESSPLALIGKKGKEKKAGIFIAFA